MLLFGYLVLGLGVVLFSASKLRYSGHHWLDRVCDAALGGCDTAPWFAIVSIGIALAIVAHRTMRQFP